MQKFCCEECQTKAKEARKKRQQDFMNAVEPVIGLQNQEYLTFAKAAILMGCSRQYVYKLVNEGKLAASRISSRMAFIRKADIEKMLAGNPYHRVLPTNRPKKSAVSTTKKEKASAMNYQSNNLESEVLDYISGEDVMRIYKVKKSWLYTSAKRNQVPVCRIAGMNYYSRKHMDALFGKSAEVEAINEWLTMKEAQRLPRRSLRSLLAMTCVASVIASVAKQSILYFSNGYLKFQSLRSASIISIKSSDFLKVCTSDSVLPARMNSVAWASSYS